MRSKIKSNNNNDNNFFKHVQEFNVFTKRLLN